MYINSENILNFCFRMSQHWFCTRGAEVVHPPGLIFLTKLSICRYTGAENRDRIHIPGERMSKGCLKGYPRDRGRVMELLIGGEFLSYPSLIGKLKKGYPFRHPFWDIPRDMYAFSVFGSSMNLPYRTNHSPCDQRLRTWCRASVALVALKIIKKKNSRPKTTSTDFALFVRPPSFFRTILSLQMHNF